METMSISTDASSMIAHDVLECVGDRSDLIGMVRRKGMYIIIYEH